MGIIDSRVSWVSSNHKTPNSAKEALLFSLLNSWIDGASVQIRRIELDRSRHKMALRFLSESMKKGGVRRQCWIKYQKRLFLDIHFFLIAIANISKIMESLKKIKSKEPEFVAIYKKYETDLNRLRYIFRNLLEHITDKPIDGQNKKGKPLKNPGDFGNLNNDDYSLFGETFNLPNTFIMFEALCNDLEKWSDNQVKKFYIEFKK